MQFLTTLERDFGQSKHRVFSQSEHRVFRKGQHGRIPRQFRDASKRLLRAAAKLRLREEEEEEKAFFIARRQCARVWKMPDQPGARWAHVEGKEEGEKRERTSSPSGGGFARRRGCAILLAI